MKKPKLGKQLKTTLDSAILVGTGGPAFKTGGLIVLGGKKGPFGKKKKDKRFKNLGY